MRISAGPRLIEQFFNEKKLSPDDTVLFLRYCGESLSVRKVTLVFTFAKRQINFEKMPYHFSSLFFFSRFRWFEVSLEDSTRYEMSNMWGKVRRIPVEGFSSSFPAGFSFLGDRGECFRR